MLKNLLKWLLGREEKTSHTAGPFTSWSEAYNYGAELVVREDAFDLVYLNNVEEKGDEIYLTYSLKERLD
jgi:hypothetical protein